MVLLQYHVQKHSFTVVNVQKHMVLLQYHIKKHGITIVDIQKHSITIVNVQKT